MGNLGTWRSPLPLRLGGKAHRRVSDIHATLVANRGSALQGDDEGRLVDAEDKMTARMIATGLHAVQRRAVQADLRSLSDAQRPVTMPDGTVVVASPLERWEAIFGIHPQPNQSVTARRAAVAGRVVGSIANSRQLVRDALAAHFGSWFLNLQFRSVADVDYPGRVPPGDTLAYWGVGPQKAYSQEYPGAAPTAALPWMSGLGIVTALVRPDATATAADIAARVNEGQRLLGDILPAWAVGTVSVLPPNQYEAGFFLDVSLLDSTAL